MVFKGEDRARPLAELEWGEVGVREFGLVLKKYI